jgi:DNA-binding SARP family transcriptional activator
MSSRHAAVIVATLRDDRLDRTALRRALLRCLDQRDAAGVLSCASAFTLAASIANDDYAGFAEAVDAVMTHLDAASELDDPGLALVAEAGEFMARYARSLADPLLPALAERLVQRLADPALEVVIRVAAAIVVLMYFEDQSDAEKIWWIELTMRSVLHDPRLGARLADEWHNRFVRACDDIGQSARADALRRERQAAGPAAVPVMEAKLALLDAQRAHWQARFDELRVALLRAEPLLQASDRLAVSEWHYLSSRLALIDDRLGPALAHARLALRLATEAQYPEQWLAATILQQGIVHMARGSCFDAVPFFEAAGRSATGVQAEYCGCLAHLARALGQVDAGADEGVRDALAAGFALVRRLEWTWFLRASPKLAARLCSLALEHGIETEFVRALIVERQFEADRPDLAAWPWRIRIRTLGRFAIEIDGVTPTLRGKGARKPLELLQFAIASGGFDVVVGGIMFALWPELEGDKARSAFNVALHRLRKLLGSDAALVLELGKLSLEPKLVWVDCLAFESLADPVTAPLAEQQVRAARRAQALYLGHFLHDDEEHAWQAVHRSRLASKFKRVVRALAEHWAGHGEPAAARNLLERAIELDPLAEDLMRELMRLLIGQGENAAALAVFERCKATLAQALGARPAPATLQLAAALKAPP